MSSTLFTSANPVEAPVFEITRANSWIKFDVKASSDIAGKLDKWDASLTAGIGEVRHELQEANCILVHDIVSRGQPFRRGTSSNKSVYKGAGARPHP